jgi:hypothetical protein
MGKTRKDMGKAWQNAHTALVEIEDEQLLESNFQTILPTPLVTSSPVLSVVA